MYVNFLNLLTAERSVRGDMESVAAGVCGCGWRNVSVYFFFPHFFFLFLFVPIDTLRKTYKKRTV